MMLRRVGIGSVTVALAVAVLLLKPAPGGTADSLPAITNVQVNQTANVTFPHNGQNQPTIAQNPTNALNLIAASNDELAPNGQGTGFYASHDGGHTWPCQGYIDLSPFGKVTFGDAWQTFDGAGNAYLSTIALPLIGPGERLRFDTADIFVAKSTDGGCTYPTVSKVASNSQNISDDKPAIAADTNPGSPHANNLYVAWTQYKDAARGADEDSKVQVVVARSSDGGATWSKPVGLSAETRAVYPGIPPRQGANVKVGPDGTVYVTWADTIDGLFVQRIAMSKDGGKKFSDPITVAPIMDEFSFPGGATFRQLGRVLPSFSISPEGSLYLAWAERQLGHTSVVLTKSTDKGASWSHPAVVADVPGRSAFFVAVAAAPSNAVDVAFLAMDDRSDETAPGAGVVSYDAYVTQSSNGGSSFGAPFKISTASSDPDVSSSHSLAVQFLGDYIAAVADASHLYVVWTDTRNGATCAAVDAFRLQVLATGTGTPPSLADCPSGFGNADIYLGTVTP
ncbi:MAG: sialidase family protein [Dehalococcoidia bacterium]